MIDLEWEEPPPEVLARSSRGRYEEVAEALRAQPERWAVLPGGARSEKGAKSTAQNIRRGVVKGFPKGQFEAVSDGVKVWVRYVTPADPPEGAEDPAEEESERPKGVPAAVVREWAQQQGILVPERGRLPQHVFDRYEAAHAPARPQLGVVVVADDGDDPWREEGR